ncbi:MAG: carboxypeptidase-like regulatory domain-containing protein, partial [Rikenellaceae bacterium]
MKKIYTFILLCLFALIGLQTASAQVIKGVVTEEATQLTIPGVYVKVVGTSMGAITDIDGNYTINNLLPNQELTLEFSTIGMIAHSESLTLKKDEIRILDVAMKEEALQADQVVVVGRRRRSNETAMISNIKTSPAVVTGISSAQITKTADSDAGEVVKRVPGISLIDNKFIIVRGLSQRYNNVWINGG